MAKNYQDIYNSVYNTGNKMDWTNAMIRGNGIPLDIYSVFDSFNAAVKYAAENAVAYEGQTLAVTENGDTTLYVITPASQGTVLIDDAEVTIYIKAVGTATIGDNKTIVLSEDGILSMKNFGVEYYAYTEKEVDGEEVVEYVKTAGWKDGLTPKVVKVVDPDTAEESYEIAWYEPSTTTVEGLSDKIATLETKVNEFDSTKANAATTLAGYGIADAYTKTETDTAISTAISGLGKVFNLVDSVTSDKFANINATDYDLGDVFLVDAKYEYVVVEDGDSKKFEMLGDPDGIAAVEDDLNKLAERVDTAEDEIDALQTDVEEISAKLETIEENAQVNKLEEVALAEDTAGEITVDGTKATISIDKVAEATSADEAKKTTGTLTAGEKTFDGSANVEITLSDLGGVAANKTATVGEFGLVKSSDGATVGDVVVDQETGKMSVSKVASATNADTAATAAKVNGTLTVLGKTYNGSEEVSITTDDIGIATTAKVGLVKSQDAGTNKVVVDADGLMTVTKVATAETAEKTQGTLTVGDKTFNGATDVVIEVADLLDTSEFATADQGTKADTAVQSVKVGNTTKTGTSVEITVDELTTDLGLKSAAYVDAATLTPKTDFDEVAGDYLSKANGGTVAGNVTFTGNVTVPAPDADTDATNKLYVDTSISAAISANDAMTFKGLLGGEGNITVLPTSGIKNGDVYKVAAEGTYDGKDAKVGDMFIALVSEGEGVNYTWEYIPSANENDGNVMAGDTLVADQIVVGNGSQDVKVLEAGTEGQVLKIVDGKPAYADETVASVESSDGSLDVTVEDNKYDVKLTSVNVDLLTQTEGDVLILDGGNSLIANA